MTIAVPGIDHVVIRARDLARMTAFYRDVLGCRVGRTREDLGLVHLRAGSGLVDLVSVDGPLGAAGGAAPGPSGRSMDHRCLRIERFDPAALADRFARHGIATGPVRTNYGADGDGPSLTVVDPEGNAIELKGSAGEC